MDHTVRTWLAAPEITAHKTQWTLGWRKPVSLDCLELLGKALTPSEGDYNYASPGFASGTGHFTQVVWKATTEIGCAIQNCADGTLFSGYGTSNYIVCKSSMRPLVGNAELTIAQASTRRPETMRANTRPTLEPRSDSFHVHSVERYRVPYCDCLALGRHTYHTTMQPLEAHSAI